MKRVDLSNLQPDPVAAAYTAAERDVVTVTGFGGEQPAAAAAARLNWQCSTDRGICPIVCYPIIVNGRVVDYWCYCDCTHPIPPSRLG